MEFWRSLKPIEKVFQPDGCFDVHQYIALCKTITTRSVWAPG